MDDKPLVIDVVDNGGQWTHREWRMLRYLKVDTQIIENTTPVENLRELDGIILSGGAARVGLTGGGEIVPHILLSMFRFWVFVQAINSWLDIMAEMQENHQFQNLVQWK